MNRPQQDSLLIVDDDQVGRDALRRRFERQGFRVTDAGTGQQALELLRAARFDLVLLDIEMPGMDGFDVLGAVRTTYPATDLPVIMITAKDQSQDVVRALQLGANDYITKPLDFPVVLARVRNQLSLNRTSHLLGVFHAQFKDCLGHFFPGAVLETVEEGEPVRWRERPPQANYRLGDIPGGRGVGIEWLRARYRFLPRERDPATPATKRLVEVIVQVLDTRYRAMFDLDMPNRLELVHHAVEDWVVAEYLWPQNPVPVLEALKMLRVAALLTYENRKVSTGVLLTPGETDPLPPQADSPPSLPRLGSWLFQEKSLQRLCDGLHTLFLADGHGRLRGVAEISQWGGRSDGDVPLPGPCPRPYISHARATLGGQNLCLVLTPSQEIKVFAHGTPVFAFRGARWQLLDIPAKFADWCQSLGGVPCPQLPRQIFQTALDLAEARHGALFVVLDRPDASLAHLVAPENRLSAKTDTPAARPRVFERVLQLTLGRATATDLGPHVFGALATVDGALVVDRAGQILAAGAVLRVALETAREEQALEGARTTAAAVASHHGPVLKVSEDGLVTFFRAGQPVWHF